MFEANISTSIDSKEYDFLWSNINVKQNTELEIKKIRILNLLKRWEMNKT